MLVFLSWILPSTLSAQAATIEGKLLSAEGPLSYATVVLLSSADSSLVKAAITEEDGRFVLKELAADTVFLQIEYLGFSPYTSEALFLEAGQNLTLPAITMSNAATELAEAVVTSTRPLIEVEADKTVFNVENTINATGSNGWELLRKAPGVIVDNNGSLIVDGKTGVQIYINGKVSPLAGDDLINYLQTLQSSDIRSIEIITQPSARYDAAGTAGIINIRLKKEKGLGTNGTVTAGFGYGQNARYNSSLSLNHRTEHAQLYGTYSNSFGKTFSFLYLDRTQNDVRYDSESETLSDNTSHNIRVGYDWLAADRHTVGVLVNANLFDGQSNTQTITPIIPLSTGALSQTLLADNRNRSDNYNLQTNLNYRYQDTTGHELNADIDYGRYQREQNRLQPNRYIDAADGQVLLVRDFAMYTPTDINILSAKIDYQQPAWGGNISAGIKASYVETDNTFDFFDIIDNSRILNTSRSNQFLYTEQINAAYLNYNTSWNKWKLQIGLRAEQTISEGTLLSVQQGPNDQVRRNYTNWFPSGGVTFQAAPKSAWALSYSRRINRPNYQSLNPFESQLDELSFSRGNPFLQPQYTDNFKLSNTYNYRMTTSLSYSHTQDYFARITDTLGSDRNFLTTLNIADQTTWSLGFSYPFQLAKWWSVYLSVSAYHTEYTGTNEKFNAIDQSTVSLYAQNTLSLPGDFRLEISGWFSSPSVWGGTYQTQSMGSLNVGLQRKFMDDRLSVRINASDILFTSFWQADMQFGELYIDGSGGWESRNINLNVSYAFGKQDVKKKRNKKSGIEEEEGRIE